VVDGKPSVDPVRIGLVGCGRWGLYILRDLLALGCTAHVADSDPAARTRALEAGAAVVEQAPEQLSADVEGFVVATQTTAHAAAIDALLMRNRPIFCEKPLAADGNTARRLAELGAGRLFVMDKWRYHPGIEQLGEAARSKAFGEVVGVCTRRRQWGTIHSDVDPIWVLLPHDLSIVREILGELPPVVAARGVRRGDWVEELDAILGTRPSATISISALSTTVERSVSVTFDDAVLSLRDAFAPNVEIMRRNDVAARLGFLPIATDMPLQRELAAFVAFLRGGPPPKADAIDAVSTIERIEQLRDRIS
jgi:predicted dehydrogenase